jgi:hypothetical protein
LEQLKLLKTGNIKLMKINKLIYFLLTSLTCLLVNTAKAQPTWSVDAHQYMYSMTFTGKIFSDGSYSADVNDMVGAFINGECRGVSNVKYIPSVNDYFVFLMVYSNSPTDNITFRIFDKSKNMEYLAKESAAFSVNGNLGTSQNPFNFTAANLNSQAEILLFGIPLQEGSTTISGKSITLFENWRGNLKGIAASFTLSSGAKAYVDGVEQTSGVTVHDFDKTIQYTVKSEDLQVSSIYSVNIATANDIPTDIHLSYDFITENAGSAAIGELSTVTANPLEKHVYTLLNNTTFFRISDDKLWPRVTFNNEEKSSYAVNIRADDLKGGVVEKTFIISIEDLNDYPSNILLNNLKTPLYAVTNTEIATLSAIDEDKDDWHNFSLATGDGINDKDNSKFIIEGNSIKTKANINFISGYRFDILVRATDKLGAFINVPISFVTLEELYSSQSNLLTFTINQQVGQTLFNGTDVYLEQHWNGDLSSIFPNFSISAGAKAFINNIGQTSGLIGNDYSNPVSFVVEAADKSRTTYTIHITLSNDIPTDITISNNTIDENLDSTIVGTFTTITGNPNEKHNYNIIEDADTDYSAFKISGSELHSVVPLDYEKKALYTVKVRADDQKGGKVDKTVTITVVNKNDEPQSINLSNSGIAVGSETNTQIGYLYAEDQDVNDSHIFSIIKGNGTNDDGNEFVKISNNKLIIAKPFTNLNKLDWNVLIKVTDSMNASCTKSLTLHVQTINHAPVFTSTSPNYIMQNQMYVNQIGTTDMDGDSISIQFENLPDWLKYNSQLNLLTGSPGNEQVGIQSFTIIASDKRSQVSQKVVLMVLDINDSPEINYFIDNQIFTTNTDNIFIIPEDCIKDPDIGDKLNYLVTMSNNSIMPSWLLFDAATCTLKGNPPKDAWGTYQLKVTATDQKLSKEWMIFSLNVSFPTIAINIEDSDSFKVFPNPVHNILNLKLPGSVGKNLVQILDLQGNIIQETSFSEGDAQSLFLGNLIPGAYFISSSNGKTRYVNKIIKE